MTQTITFEDALAQLGVRDNTLTTDEKIRLDRDGYLPLPGILSAAQIARMRARLDELVGLEGENAGTEVHREQGTDRLSDLVNKASMFEVCFTHPRVLAGIARVISGPFKLSSLNSRAALPGQGLQNLHADWR